MTSTEVAGARAVSGPETGPRVTRMASCSFCGATVESDEPPLTWTSAVERGRLLWFCDTCSREHLRAMEGKLDSEWW